jgi:NADPH:quinone reductase-like Zn-dependent oxidoreductase
MKALTISEQFGIDQLRWTERPRPEPRPNEALVRIAAVSLNHRDLDIIAGKRKVALPLIPASDAAGIVVSVGAEVRGLAVGDRVMPTFVQGWLSGPQPAEESLPTLGGPLEGVLREYGTWPESGLVKVPARLSDIAAATLPCAAVSAWNALFVATSVQPGQSVLVQGTGGVALFALQFAKRAGAIVIATSSSDEKLERAKTLGADFSINYRREPNWGAKARQLAGGGLDCIVEVGGAETIAQSIAAVKNGGHISFVGFLSGTAANFDLGELSRKSIRLNGIRVGSRASFQAMCEAIECGTIEPVVDSVFPFADAHAALTRLESGQHFGKVCISFA